MSDETLQNWVTNMHNLSSLDKSIVRSIDVQDMLQHGFSFDPAKFRDFVPSVELTLLDSSLTIGHEWSFIISEKTPLEENDEIWCFSDVQRQRSCGQKRITGRYLRRSCYAIDDCENFYGS